MKNKDSLRKHYLRLLKEQNKEDALHKSSLIAAQLWELPVFKAAQSIMFYVSMPVEVDTLAMIQKALSSGKRVAVPLVEQNQRILIPTLISSMKDLNKETLGIAQPDFDGDKILESKEIDAVIVPGLAFDKNHNRLGRGMGYYDRFLSTLSKDTTSIGLAFDFQLHPNCLPVEAHDMRLNHIIVG